MRLIVYLWLISIAFLLYIKAESDTHEKIRLLVSGVTNSSTSIGGIRGYQDVLGESYQTTDEIVAYKAKNRWDEEITTNGGLSFEIKESPKETEPYLIRYWDWGRYYHVQFAIRTNPFTYDFAFLYDRLPVIIPCLLVLLASLGSITLIAYDRRQLAERSRHLGMLSAATSSHDMRSSLLKLAVFQHLFQQDKQRVDYSKQLTILGKMIENVRKFGPVTAQKSDFTSINLVEVVEKMSTCLPDLDSNKSIQFDLQAKALYTSEELLERIVYNLLSNAFKYSDTYVKAHSSYQKRYSNNYICIKVSNDYDLKEKDNVERDAFKYRSRFSNSIGKDSSGIGLYNVKCCTEALGGNVKIDRSAHYFTIVVELPMVKLPTKKKEGK